MKKTINIIDLFAGPGGLGEGFSSYKTSKGIHPFKIQVSVEKDASAHATLQLRAFYRQFRESGAPSEYYDYIKNPDNLKSKELENLKKDLFSKYHRQSSSAIEETLHHPQTLGTDESDQVINKKLSQLLSEHEDEDFVVIGGPPCQAYSLAGRSRMSGIDGYKIEDDHRASLYKEYLKVINKVQPSVFVMENVKGILSAKLEGEKVFPKILEDLRDPGKALNEKSEHQYHIYSLVAPPDDDEDGSPIYKDIRSFIIRAEEYGIPQNRHRVILLGVRKDLNKTPLTLEKAEKQTSVKAVINGLPALRSGLSKGQSGSSEYWASEIKKSGKFLIKQLEKDNFKEHADLIHKHLEKIRNDLERGNRFVSSNKNGFQHKFNGPLKEWMSDPKLNGYLNHETKAHMFEDLKRYLWISTYAELNSYSPKSSDFPRYLAPDHKNWKTGDHADRFKVQIMSKPSSTITCHLSKDGHSSIHYNPEQCRSFTVREAARIQTFPDNYFFEGTRTQQYIQVGNAVPPYLAKQIAEIVVNLL